MPVTDEQNSKTEPVQGRDIDTAYHFALPELREAVTTLGTDESRELLDMMIDGQRLKDVADLPLDLTV